MIDYRECAALGVATIYEAAGRSGLIDIALHQLVPRSRAAGPARTVRCGQDDNLMVHAAIERITPGDIVVLTMPEPRAVALIGDLLLTQIEVAGAAGVLVDAAVRDAEDLARMQPPVWSRFIRVRGAAKTIVGEIDVPVTVGGTTIAPGDLVVLDADGACAIPAADVPAVLAAARQRLETERRNRERYAAGEHSYDLNDLRKIVTARPRVNQTAIPCTLMRGGTSKGPFFLGRDLPEDARLRDRVLLAALGSPDLRQIDGVGGADPLTSKVAIVGPSTRPDADVDYLFLQVVVNEARVDTSQNCGNMLAGVGPFAIERGLVAAGDPHTTVRIHMVNTASVAVAQIETPGGRVRYDGDARIDGVPGTAAPIRIDFLDIAGGTCGTLLPTGNRRDVVADTEVTLIDNGMPVVVMRAADFGCSGRETPAELEADDALRARVERVRLAAGPLMNLGDVGKKNVPKMCLVAPAQNGGTISTRTFIPHKVHAAIGVFGAVSVATACALPGSVAAELAAPGASGATAARALDIEHPTGFFTVDMEIDACADGPRVRRSALLRTARALMTGDLLVPGTVWRNTSA